MFVFMVKPDLMEANLFPGGIRVKWKLKLFQYYFKTGTPIQGAKGGEEKQFENSYPHSGGKGGKGG